MSAVNTNKLTCIKNIRVKCVESEEYRELKAEIETIKEQIVKLEKELLSVKRLAEKAYDTAAML